MGKSEKMIDVINDLASKSGIFLQNISEGLLSSYEDEDKLLLLYHNMV